MHKSGRSPKPEIPDPQSHDLYTPTIAEIHLGSLRHNLDVFRGRGAEVMAVVKADAYGHGAPRIARELSDAGVTWLAVATAAEGAELRRAGVQSRILVLAAPLPDFLDAYHTFELDIVVSSKESARAVADASRQGRPMRAHVKVDTGMSRMGLRPGEVEDVVVRLDREPGVEITSLWTHLATADEPEMDFTYRQLETFRKVVDDVGDAARHIHVANSAAALRMPESIEFERALTRPGIGLYGYTGLEGLDREFGLRPVMRLISKVTHTAWVEAGTSVSYGRRWTAQTRTRIATVGAGYADGFPWSSAGRASVSIGTRRYPVAGTVCMDMLMVDVGTSNDVAPGDEVVLFGPEGPDASELARWAGTIAYEVLTGIAPRVPRIYFR